MLLFVVFYGRLQHSSLGLAVVWQDLESHGTPVPPAEHRHAHSAIGAGGLSEAAQTVSIPRAMSQSPSVGSSAIQPQPNPTPVQPWPDAGPPIEPELIARRPVQARSSARTTVESQPVNAQLALSPRQPNQSASTGLQV